MNGMNELDLFVSVGIEKLKEVKCVHTYEFEVYTDLLENSKSVGQQPLRYGTLLIFWQHCYYLSAACVAYSNFKLVSEKMWY